MRSSRRSRCGKALVVAIVVAFVSQKGGVGKSTLARALAPIAASGGLAVTLVDLDARQQTLRRWQNARKTNRVVPSVIIKEYARFEDMLADEIATDLVVIDAPGGASRATLEIARRVDLLVQPTAGSLDDLYPSVLLFHELTKAGIPRSRLVFALCRILSKREEDASRAYLGEAGYDVLPGSIPEREAYRDAQNQGQSLTETRDSTLNERADALVAGLLVRLGMALNIAVGASTGKGNKDKGAAA